MQHFKRKKMDHSNKLMRLAMIGGALLCWNQNLGPCPMSRKGLRPFNNFPRSSYDLLGAQPEHGKPVLFFWRITAW